MKGPLCDTCDALGLTFIATQTPKSVQNGPPLTKHKCHQAGQLVQCVRCKFLFSAYSSLLVRHNPLFINCVLLGKPHLGSKDGSDLYPKKKNCMTLTSQSPRPGKTDQFFSCEQNLGEPPQMQSISENMTNLHPKFFLDDKYRNTSKIQYKGRVSVIFHSFISVV